MKIINEFKNINDIENIASLTRACLTAIRQKRSGDLLYIKTEYHTVAVSERSVKAAV